MRTPLLLATLAMALLSACNSNSETRKTEDSTGVVDKMGHTVDTAGTITNPADTATSVSDIDREFVMKVAMTNTAEVQVGQLATTKGGSDAVKQYGDMMIRDHTDAQNRIKGLATSLSLPAPDSVDAKHKALKEKLGKLSGAAFDKEYKNAMVEGHKEAITLFEKQASSGTNGQLRTFATENLPKLKAHLDSAEKL
jgi:putative membrane protein